MSLLFKGQGYVVARVVLASRRGRFVLIVSYPSEIVNCKNDREDAQCAIVNDSNHAWSVLVGACGICVEEVHKRTVIWRNYNNVTGFCKKEGGI